MEGEEQTLIWNKETVPKVMKIVSARLCQRDLISLLFVGPWLHRILISYPSLCLAVDLREMSNAGGRFVAALSLPRYQHVKQIGLEFAQDIDDDRLEVLKNENLSDKSLQLVADNYQELELLNLTSFTDEAHKKISVLSHLRFVDLCGAQVKTKVTDMGFIAIVEGCTSLEFLSLFGVVGVMEKCLEAVSKFCSNTIITLDVNGCIGIKRRSHDDLHQLFPQLFPHLRCFKVHS